MSTTPFSHPLTFNEGVFLVPVSELPDDLRRQLDGREGDIALTRPQGRSSSKVVDRDAADLLERFREPRTLAEAVLLYSRARGAEPQGVLEDAFPLVRSLLSTGYLVPLRDGAAAPTAGGSLEPRWRPGDELLEGRILRAIQVLEDSELYLLRRPDGVRVLKIARPAAGGEGDGADGGAAALTPMVVFNFEREAEVLRVLGGAPAPELVASGMLDGCPWLELEHLPGRGLETELTSLAGRRSRLALARAVVAAYARLHRRGVVHGDVHPRNLLVLRDGEVRLVDFGFARCIDGPEDRQRGGVPFFYEPELARAYLEGAPPPPCSTAGEQYAVAVLLYLLFTGAHPRDWSLGRDEMLREIVELPPLPFAERGAGPWPAVETVLARALAKDPAERYPSMAELAAALGGVEWGAVEEVPGEEVGEEPLRRCRAAARPGGAWWERQRLPAPSASVNYGAAGISLALLHLAGALGSGGDLALADPWLERARHDVGQSSAGESSAGESGDGESGDGGLHPAFYDAELDITPGTVGESSPYHSAAGIHLVAALLARARGDAAAQSRATAAFLEVCETPPAGLDLTLGRASHLLGATLLLDATPRALEAEEAALGELGDRTLKEIWRRLDSEPEIEHAGIDYPGIAHGWAGLLYATLAWCAVRGTEVPDGVGRRCGELAALAAPDGRGLTWPWTLHGEGRRATMPGWCNGSCGYVFLWILAHRWSGEAQHLELALGAAWDAWDAADSAHSLCCGLAGRGYALLALHRHTGDDAWLRRARRLAARGAAAGEPEPDRAHCLYKGELGLAVLAADLRRPEAARMPLFEPAGYRTAAF